MLAFLKAAVVLATLSTAPVACDFECAVLGGAFVPAKPEPMPEPAEMFCSRFRPLPGEINCNHVG